MFLQLLLSVLIFSQKDTVIEVLSAPTSFQEAAAYPEEGVIQVPWFCVQFQDGWERLFRVPKLLFLVFFSGVLYASAGADKKGSRFVCTSGPPFGLFRSPFETSCIKNATPKSTQHATLYFK